MSADAYAHTRTHHNVNLNVTRHHVCRCIRTHTHTPVKKITFQTALLWISELCNQSADSLRPREARFQKTERSTVIFWGASPKFSKPHISSSSESVFFGVWGDFWGRWIPFKRGICLYKNSLASKLFHHPSWVVISRIWKTFCKTSSGVSKA